MKDTPSKLDQIRALGSTEIFRRFGAPTERKPVPEVPGVTKGPPVRPVDSVDTPVDRSVDRKAYQREWLRKKREAKHRATSEAAMDEAVEKYGDVLKRLAEK
jgi:hypothetical protein